MRRRATLALVLLAVFWQSLAMACVGPAVNVLADLEHAALHWQDAGHHHHDDGSYHPDDSRESAQHVLTDPLGASLAPWTPPAPDVAQPGSAPPGGRPEAPAPDPALDGPLRPPRAGA